MYLILEIILKFGIYFFFCDVKGYIFFDCMDEEII